MPDHLDAPTKSADALPNQLSINDLSKSDMDSFTPNNSDSTKTNDVTLARFEGDQDNKFELESKPYEERTDVPPESNRESPLEGDKIDEHDSVKGNEQFQGFGEGSRVALDKDGNFHSAEVSDGNVRYNYRVTPDGIARMRTSGAGVEVTDFGKDGKPLAAKSYADIDDEKGREAQVHPDDSVTVKTNEFGDIILRNTDKYHETESKLVITKDGVLKTRHKQFFNEQTEAEYNDDGTLKNKMITEYGVDGYKDRSVHTDKDGITSSEYDDKGKLEKEHFKGNDIESYAKHDDKGNWVKDIDMANGARAREVTQPDGTRHRLLVEGDSTQYEVTNPDGSSTNSVESKDHSIHEIRDADGNWVRVHHNKQTGMQTVTKGDKHGQYEGSLDIFES